MDNRWVSVEEIARHLGVAKDTVYRWIDQRGLPAHRVGRLWKFQIPEVDEWVKSGGADASNGRSHSTPQRKQANGNPPEIHRRGR
jgi:excisionase family DNA binding protein